MNTHTPLHGARALLAAGSLMISATLAHAGQTSWMAGGNWADGRDNYVSGWIIPSGLTSSSTEAQATAKATQISAAVRSIGIRVVRLGINPDTVLNDTWWKRYRAIITKFKADNLHVILGCWEAPGASKDGKIDDYAKWKSMWQKVDGEYASDSSIWFEPFNEPFGYTAAQLKTIYKDFQSFTTKSDGRILLGGTGYSEDIGPIANDAAFNNCKFSLHIYSWFGNHTTEAAWKTELNNRLDGYQDRVLITEMGAPATDGKNYGATSTEKTIAYIRGVTARTRELGVGAVYWPTHRDGDGFRLFNNTTDTTVTNTSLKDRMRYGWGL